MKKLLCVVIPLLFLICCGGDDSNKGKYKVTYSVISNPCPFESIYYLENASYYLVDTNNYSFCVNNDNIWSYTFYAKKGDMLEIYATRNYGCNNFDFTATILINDEIIKEESVLHKEYNLLIVETTL